MFDFLWNLWPVLVVAIIIYAAITLVQLLGGRDTTPYQKRPRLVTNSELKFFHTLRKAVDGDWEIFVMVRIADLLKVPKGIKNRRSWVNKILSKHIDFVLCEPDSLEVVLGIELDDPSHERPHRMQRDKFVNAAFADAGIPLLRIPTEKKYDPRDLRRKINRAL